MNTKDKEVTKNDNINLVKENRKLKDVIERQERDIKILNDIIIEN